MLSSGTVSTVRDGSRWAGFCFALLVLLVVPAFNADASSGSTTTTSDGDAQRQISFYSSSWNNTTSVTVPSGAVVTYAGFTLGGLPDQTGLQYPVSPGLSINNTWVWMYAHGELGRSQSFQEVPAGGNLSLSAGIPATIHLKLPALSHIVNASLAIYTDGLLDPFLDIGSDGVFDWQAAGLFCGTASVNGLGARLESYLASTAGVDDSWGNMMVQVPFELKAASNGTMSILSLFVQFESNLTTSNLSSCFNGILQGTHQPGNLTIPLGFYSGAAGTIHLKSITIKYLLPDINSPPTALLSTPSEGTALYCTTVDFNWTASDPEGDPLVFNFHLKHPDGHVEDLTLSSSHYVRQNMAYGDYTWWMYPNDGKENGTCIPALLHFRIVQSGPPPGPPVVTLTQPTNGSTVPAGIVELRWTAADFVAAQCRYYIYLDESQGKAFYAWVSHPTTLIRASNLTAGKTYFWTVVPETISGTNTTRGSCASGMWKFLLKNETPGSNRQPDISSVPPSDASASYEYYYQVTATDRDGDRLTYSLRTGPDGMYIDFQSGTVRWRPRFNQTGNHSIIVTVSDGKAISEQQFSVTVRGASQPPLPTIRITGPTEGQVVNRSIYAYGIFSSAPEAPGVARVEVKFDSGQWLQANIGTDGWTILLDTSKFSNGVHRLTARAYDGISYSGEAVVNITFENPQYVLLNYNVSKDPDFTMALALLVALMIIVPVGLFYYIRSRYSGGPQAARGGKRVVYRPVPPAVIPEMRRPPPEPAYEPPPPAEYRQPTAATQFKSINCPKCRNSFKVERTPGPQKIRCPHCGASGTIR
jgi:hypothetical protein